MSQLNGHLPEAEKMLKRGEAAARLGIQPQTLSAWARAGRIDCRHTPGGHRIYPESAVSSVLDAMTAAGAQS